MIQTKELTPAQVRRRFSSQALDAYAYGLHVYDTISTWASLTLII